MAFTTTSAMKLDSQKAKEWGGASCKIPAFILAMPSSRLKIHVLRKRFMYRVKTDSDKKIIKPTEWFTECLKVYID